MMFRNVRVALQVSSRYLTMASTHTQTTPVASTMLRGARMQNMSSMTPFLHPVRHFSKGYELESADMSEDDRWKKKVDLNFGEVEKLAKEPSLDTILLDVREKSETAGGMIPSAVNVPLSELMAAFQLHPSIFQHEYGFPRPDENTKIATYCRSGKRSATARDLLSSRGFDNVRSYTGSWTEWQVKHIADEDDN